MVVRLPVKEMVASSSLALTAKAFLAHLVEQDSCKVQVIRSNRIEGSIINKPMFVCWCRQQIATLFK